MVAGLTEFNGCNNISSQGNLVHALCMVFETGELSTNQNWSIDARKIGTRCYNKVKEMSRLNVNHIEISHEQFFELLVDVNWLFASKYVYELGGQNDITLLNDFDLLPLHMMGSLEKLRKKALYDMQQCEKIAEASKLRWQVVPGLCFDPEVKKYLNPDYYQSDYDELQASARKCSIYRMCLFFALTATAIKSEEIRRQQ